MLETSKIIERVMGASGDAKRQIISINQDNVRLKAILKFIYDPYNKCCIGQAKLVKALERMSVGHAKHTYIEPEQIISFLTANNTGSDAATNNAASFVLGVEDEFHYPAATMLAMAIVTQNLKMGLATKTLNSIYGLDFIPVVGCMLGTLYSKVNNVQWPCIETEKLDGIRRIAIKRNGVTRLFSRSGHEDFGCVDILAECKHLPDNRVYDGELLAIGTFKDNIELRQATSSIANSGGDKRGLSFNVFDMIPVDEFFAGESNDNALIRKTELSALFGDEGLQFICDNWYELIIAYQLEFAFTVIKVVPILGLARSMNDVTPIVEALWAQRKEGVMLNTTVGKYQVKRSKHLLKLKDTQELTLKVVGFTEGIGRNEDVLGALVVDYKGSKVGVGGRLSDAMRYEIWNNQEKYLGKYIELDTFGESTNAAGGVSLNCAIFKRFVGDEE